MLCGAGLIEFKLTFWVRLRGGEGGSQEGVLEGEGRGINREHKCHNAAQVTNATRTLLRVRATRCLRGHQPAESGKRTLSLHGVEVASNPVIVLTINNRPLFEAGEPPHDVPAQRLLESFGNGPNLEDPRRLPPD